jgi:hypothetical protein
MANLTPLLLNNVSSTVQAGSSAIGSASATGISVASGDGANFGTIGTDQYIPAVVIDTSTTPETVKEYVWITARSTDALTVVRQAEDSSRYPASTTTIQAGFVIAAVASQNVLLAQKRGGASIPADNKFLAWNYSPFLQGSGSTNGSNGMHIVNKLWIPTTIAVSNIVMWVATAGATLTANSCFAGIYDSSGSLLMQTADQSAAWTSTGLKTMSVSGGPVTIAGGPGVWVWASIITTGTTRPKFAAILNTTLDVNVNLAATDGWVNGFKSSVGTSLPASITLTDYSANPQPMWTALS